MKATTRPLTSYQNTVAHIIRIAREYTQDVSGFDNFFQLYNYVRDLPYKSDPVNQETVSRFLYTKNYDFPIRDCDDKTVPLVSYAILKKIPVRVVVCGEIETPHHVYPEIFFGDSWLPADATYDDRCSFGKYLYNEKFRKIFSV
ncbi:MAG TPA: hypothetical protein PK079_26360 [Leptospiraceae bacterium]|nr:hypothetical protein [Leptospiraceae bacterium]HMX35544.1 hypothetical protein [Leptospiraceae bacterium]HNC59879.1 hypothetical protein [Leptospiraceae bacterium]HNE56714.1 hypothetical protein [Leptospiraceae bacterium]HNH03012.1 hypothetical protein [Leptospiraceae bacterium]